MCVICLTPQLSVEAIPLFASEASNRVVAMRVRPAIAGSCAARTPEHQHQADLQKSRRRRGRGRRVNLTRRYRGIRGLPPSCGIQPGTRS